MTLALAILLAAAVLALAYLGGRQLVANPPRWWNIAMSRATAGPYVIIVLAGLVLGWASFDGWVKREWWQATCVLWFPAVVLAMWQGGNMLFTELNFRRIRRKLVLPREAEAIAVLRATWGAPADWAPVVFWVPQEHLTLVDGTWCFPTVVGRGQVEWEAGVCRSAGAFTVALPDAHRAAPFTTEPFVHEAKHSLKLKRGEEMGDPLHTGAEWETDIVNGTAALLDRGIR